MRENRRRSLRHSHRRPATLEQSTAPCAYDEWPLQGFLKQTRIGDNATFTLELNLVEDIHYIREALLKRSILMSRLRIRATGSFAALQKACGMDNRRRRYSSADERFWQVVGGGRSIKRFLAEARTRSRFAIRRSYNGRIRRTTSLSTREARASRGGRHTKLFLVEAQTRLRFIIGQS